MNNKHTKNKQLVVGQQTKALAETNPQEPSLFNQYIYDTKLPTLLKRR